LPKNQWITFGYLSNTIQKAQTEVWVFYVFTSHLKPWLMSGFFVCYALILSTLTLFVRFFFA